MVTVECRRQRDPTEMTTITVSITVSPFHVVIRDLLVPLTSTNGTIILWSANYDRFVDSLFITVGWMNNYGNELY